MRAEVDAFIALPSVGAAFDVLAHVHDPDVEIRWLAPRVPADTVGPVRGVS